MLEINRFPNVLLRKLCCGAKIGCWKGLLCQFRVVFFINEKILAIGKSLLLNQVFILKILGNTEGAYF